MKISLVTNNMGISDKLRFRHHILSLMLGLPVVLRENLIVDDNPEITKTWTLLQDSTLPHSYAYRGQKGDNYGTT